MIAPAKTKTTTSTTTTSCAPATEGSQLPPSQTTTTSTAAATKQQQRSHRHQWINPYSVSIWREFSSIVPLATSNVTTTSNATSAAWNNNYCYIADNRRWASSIINIATDTNEDEDDIDGDDDDDDERGNNDDANHNDTTTTVQHLVEDDENGKAGTQKKKKKSKRQKRKYSLAGQLPLNVKFLHFQDYVNDSNISDSYENNNNNTNDTKHDRDELSESYDESYHHSQATKILQDDFDRLACDHDLAKFKWISSLEKILILKLQREQEHQQQQQGGIAAANNETSNTGGRRKRRNKNAETLNAHANYSESETETDRLRDYWKVALKAASNEKRVPADLKAQFLARMVVQQHQQSESEDNNDDDDNYTPAVASMDGTTDSFDDADIAADHEDARLLARGRDLAVEHPLLWRRYSAKERKQKVKVSKQLIKEKLEEIANNNNNNNSNHYDYTDAELEAMAVASAARGNLASLDFYLHWIRTPALRKTHYSDKTDDQRTEEAREMQRLLKTKLPETSYRKMLALAQSYVDCFVDDNNNDTTTGKDDDNDDEETLVTLQTSPFTTFPSSTPHTTTSESTVQTTNEGSNDDNDSTKTSATSNTTKEKKIRIFRVLLSNLRKVLPRGRLHWVGKDVADFFYVTAPDEVDLMVAGRERKKDDPVTPNHQTFDSFDMDLVTQDSVLGHSQANWNEVRDKYVQSFLNIQKLFLKLEKEQQQQQQRMERHRQQQTGNFSLQEIDENNDPSSETSVVQTFDIVTALSRLDKKMATTERVRPREYIPLEAMAMGEYWKTSLGRNAGGTDKTSSTKANGDDNDTVMSDLLESKTKHLGMTHNKDDDGTTNGLLLPNKFEVFDNDSFPLAPPVERLVVVDNLPIDINEQRLREAYGRCGTIEAVQIFHSRPDLDPGRRSTDSSKKIRSPSSSSRRQKWVRPRTPLYAMVLYKDAKSAKKAGCDPLRIFGMVLDHHLMRSHRASDMTVLYLEDVPSSLHTVSSMEFELSQLLCPADLYLCLDDSGHNRLRKKGAGKKQHPLSYTIKFPSFEAAYWSYWKLSLELQLLRDKEGSSSSRSTGTIATGPALHWMETPKDAQLYWTRKLNF